MAPRQASSAAHALMLCFVSLCFFVTRITAQGLSIAPLPALETGDALSLPVSGAVTCCSMVASLIAFLVLLQ
ncbi:hypothetical protein FH972_016870 [Carpinus fangiana]|uniref:Uncharacterized protein n=1 Tax=Carpinus fangiana TaxID=176857 RepID=A0A5N6RJ82_9ROSI|nr:hypothetical protein FH972_016870 [Carpinus fangiana]